MLPDPTGYASPEVLSGLQQQYAMPEWATPDVWAQAIAEAQARIAGTYTGTGSSNGILRTTEMARQSGDLTPLINAIAAGNVQGAQYGGGENLTDILRTGMLAYGGLATAGGLGFGPLAAGSGAAGATGALTGVPALPEGVGYMAGGVPAVDAAAFSAAGAIPGMASLPAQIATPAAVSAFTGSGGASSGPPPTPQTGGGGGIGNSLSNIPEWVGNYLIPGLNTLLGYDAADDASDAMAEAAQNSIAEQRRQYDTTRADLMPWLDAGRDALGQLNNPGNYFQASPDYGFRRSEGTRGIENSFAAQGMGQSGNALKALTEFNSGLASGEYGNWWNRQAGRAGVGQTTGAQLGQLGANSAANIGGTMQDYGQARASGYLGRNAAIGNGLNDGFYNALYRRRA